MHFRVRRNVVQFVRTTYDAASKRPRAQVVGRVQRGATSVPEALVSLLTAEEAAQAEAWLGSEQRTALLREELAARTLGDTLAMANRWFSRQENLAEHDWIQGSILPELQRLRKTIRRAVG